MSGGILVLGELHGDLYYENDFFELLVERIADRVFNFLYYNPDDFSRKRLKNITVKTLSNLPKKVSSSCYMKRGGNGNNSAECLVTLGVPTKLVSVIGRGSEWMIKELKELGIDTRDIYHVNELTPISTIIKSNLTTKIFVAPELKERMNFKSIPVSIEDFKNYKIIFTTPMAEKFKDILEKSQQFEYITAFNIELQKLQTIDQLNQLVEQRHDILFLNLKDAEAIINKQCNFTELDDIFKRWARIRIYTNGKEGSLIASDNTSVLEIPALEVKVIDRTGAGDCYAAGFLAKFHELIKNKQQLNSLLMKENSNELLEILKECAFFATHVSAYKISSQKPPTKKEINEFIEERGGDKI
ncbi:MAG: carbohydrate kinase family protein [Promethearchaeota archaeon]